MSERSERLAGMSPEKLQRLIDSLRAKAPAPAAAAPAILRRQPDLDRLPLSFSQERLWFLDRLDPGSPVFNLPAAVELRGNLRAAALAAALAEVVRRHEALRTSFAAVDGIPVQRIAPPGQASLALPRIDLAALPEEARGREAARLASEYAAWRFDLARGPLLAAALLRLEDGRHHLLLAMHHIVSDGWSMGILIREVAALYAAFAEGKPSPLPELSLQYSDFAVWQRETAAAERAKDLAWWSERLSGQAAPLDLPADRPRPAVQTWRGGWVVRTLPADLSDRLRSFGQAEGASLFMTMLAGVQALLHRLAGRDDVVVGSPIAGRRMAETEPLIGFFLNLLALRTDVAGDPGFRELVKRVREVTLGAYAHQDLPFEALLNHLQPERDLSRTPLFQVLFNLLNFPLTEQRLPGLEIEAISLPDLPSKFDLTFYVRDDPTGIAVRMAYNADLFDAVRMEELLDQLALLLASGLEDPELGVDRISLAATPRARAVLPDPAAQLSAAWEGAVHEVFARCARHAPEALAAVDPAESWTYGELDERSSRLAAFLHASGVRSGDVVAFWAHRSAPLVWGVLGALKAGAAFLMLDPRYPAPRQAQMLGIARPAAWLRVEAAGPVPAEIESELDAIGCACRLALPARAGDEGFLSEISAEPPTVEVGPGDVAYVAFTSGSTGVPKGVLGRHGSLSHFIPWLRSRFELSAADRFSMLSGLAHDPLHRDLFTPLQIGAAVVIPDPETMDEPGRLAAWMRREAVTVAHLTPALGQVLTTESPNRPRVEVPSLRWVFLVGDVLTRRDVARLRRLAPAVTCVNYYGSTETQRAVGYHVAAEDGPKEILPLGRGIPDVQILVLNPAGALAGIGELGEISMRSPHLALGYLGDPQLTAERFVADLYRTGDLGRYLPNGEAVFVGRADTQVKIRGFRIELGEIESVLGGFPGVREAVVIARQDRGPELYLAAYVVPAAGITLAARELRAFLRERLPDSMVPATFTLLDELPLTPNRKVDRKALPAPDRGAKEAAFVAPETDLERQIAAVWQEVLGVERVGVHDNFFELGGHSLLGTQLLSRLRDELGVELPIVALFESPTPAEQAARIETARGDATETAPPIERLPRTGSLADLPLSFAQERFWFLDQLQPGSAAYNIPSALRLEGPLDVAALASALTGVARRHESLRTTFPAIDGAPVQRIAPPGPFPLALVDLAGLPEEAREAEGERLAVEEPRAPFNLAKGPLARAFVVRLDERDHLLLTTLHHIISDGWSLGLFVREVAALYRTFASGEATALPELPVQYADFASWQRRWLSGPVLEERVAWWRERLTPPPPVLELPMDRPRPAAETFRGGRQPLALPGELTGALATLGREQGATLFMTLLAGFSALLGRLTYKEDLAVGSPIAGRTRGEVEDLIGLFINTLVLRTDLAGDPTFIEALARARETALGAYAHQELPFERLVEELRPERSLGHSPLFQVLFILQNLPSEEVATTGLTLRPLDVYHGVARFDLTLSATEIEGRLRGYLEFKTDLLDAATAARWLGHLGTLLAAAVADPDRRLSELPLLSDAERRQVLEDWNGTAVEVPAACVHQLIAERAARSPEEVAVVCEGERLTRAELEERATRLAGRLRASGVGPESLVGIALERSLDLLVAVLGVWKAGAAYLPLDPGYPAERIGFMLADSGARVVLTHERLAATLPEHGARVLCLDREPDIDAEPVDDGGAGPDHLAYVLYTSGSTGRPKGVQVPHGALVNFLLSMRERPGLGVEDVLVAVTSLSFDIAGLELYLPLLAGARLVVATREEAQDGARLRDLLADCGATVLQATPATWRLLIDSGWTGTQGLRALCGGEALPEDLAAALLERSGSVWNLYGPTETTIWSAVCQVLPGRRVSIGRPIANTTAHLVDPRGSLVPPGVPGELLLGGAGVTRGYLGRPDLTAERFVPDPFGPPGGRLYRTGDLVRRRLDGELEFLGRLDHQVKVRGFRIELGEIEAALHSHPAVAQAVAGVRDLREGKVLVAWVVPADGARLEAGKIDPAELREHLRARLPEYMLPGAWSFLPALPLTPNGKIDRRGLPEPGRAAAAVYEPPRSSLERAIAGIWQELLGVEEVGVHDNFFEIGGHSLLIPRFQARLREGLGREIGIVEFFGNPTVASLAHRLSREDGAAGEIRPRREPRAPREGRTEVAIIAMAGRFPRAADLEQHWRNLREGVEAISSFSEEEMIAAGISGELLRNPSFVRAGAVLEDADLFDAELFGILPSEAELIDPQQRLLLEYAWEALEKAGYAGTKRAVGVFAGTSENTYLHHCLLSNPEVVSSAGMLGLAVASSRDFVATRLAYKLDLSGPAVSVQTACSTSLVAVHMACQSLLAGECELALAGGSSVRAQQRTGYVWQPGGITSPDGHCRAFDARAQGTVSGQGTGVVVLKRLEDALADGDPILAVIKGSAINNDGALKAGFTAPSPEGQAQVIRAAQLRAGVDPATIGFVEAHGTATPLGDPIEVAALIRAFGLGTDHRGFCALGSVKTNIGHLDAAAGMAGLIKAVLSLEHKEIPPTLHFEAPNPEIDFAASPFFVNTKPIPWLQRAGVPRRGGVSSFGLGGTNAHVVLEEAPPAEPSGPSRPWQLLLLSAGTPTALERATDNLAGYLAADPEQSLADVAWTLQVGRKTFRHRRALVTCGVDEAAALLAGRDPKRVWTMAGERGNRPVAFLLPGVGDQYAGMARQLYEGEPVFREELDRCAGILLPLLGLDIREFLLEESPAAAGSEVDLRTMLRGAAAPRSESPLHTTRVAQPAMLALGWSLARLWTSWGVRPQALLGYSLGEYTAACLAGVLTIEDGLTLAARRAGLIESLPPGAMLAVPLPEAEIAALLPPALSIAAVNAPAVCVISGPADAVEDLQVRLAADGLPCRRLGTAHAFHSQEMEPIANEFRKLLRSIRLAPPRLPYLSNVTGTWITPGQATDPGYWVEHLLRTVRFADGVAELWREPGRVLLEMGPGQALASLAAQQGGAQGSNGQLALASLPHEMDRRPAQQVLLGALGQLWLAGVEIDWEGFRGDERRRRVALPGYPFERKRFWIEHRPAAPSQPAGSAPLDVAGRLPEMADWFHAPLWKPSVRPAKKGVGTGRWLLLADELGVGAELASRLRAAGLEVETVRGDDPEALERALRRSPSRIVHLWTLGNQNDGDIRELGFHGLLALARALGRGTGTGTPEGPILLDIVTDGLCRVDRGDRLQPGKAMLLGPLRVIPQEYPRIHCRALDIDLEERRNDLIAQLLTELLGDGTEPLVAWRGRQRWVPGWEPMRFDGTEGSPFRENGAYLITGGTGGIGLALAGHLARTVRARLALVSRRGLPEASAAVRELEALGAEVLVLGADVADEAQMRRAVAAARDRFGALHGVFHAAGVPGGGLIQLKAREAADAVLAPKVDGTRVLQSVLTDVLGDDPPELLVLFSSINSVTGGLGQVDYCAANAYLDAVAEAGAGPVPCVAIDWCEWKWDAWTEGTIADPRIVAGLRQQREEYGLGFAEGMEALERILASGLRRVVVSTRDLRAVLAQRHSLPEVLGGLDHLAESRSGRATRPRPELPVPYAAPEIEDHRRLAAVWQELLGLEGIGIHDDFFQLGGHSLLGLQLLSRLQSAFGVEVPLRTLFDAPTIAELSVALHDLRSSQGTQTAAVEKIAVVDPQSLLENLQELSDEEMTELLARMTAQEDSRA